MWNTNEFKNIKKKFKTKNIYNLRPVVTYGCETWTLASLNGQQLRIFERKILRKMFGPIQDENGIWRIRKNHELNELIGNADIVRFI